MGKLFFNPEYFYSNFSKDFQLYADIARELPLIKTDHSSSELIVDDDTLKTIGHLVQVNLKEYL
jgi:hypothetical protein